MLCKKLKLNLLKGKKQSDMMINEVLFYGGGNEEVSRQMGINNILCIYYMITHTSRTIHMCVPNLVSETLTKYLIELQRTNKVKIKIIVHNSKDTRNLHILAENKIEVKLINPQVRLEHEFILIDASNNLNDAVAIMGSLDYDIDQVNLNIDATLLTSEASVVATLKSEFNRIWYSLPDKTVPDYLLNDS